MADDRQGRSPRPGGRPPWERYPAGSDPEADGAHSSRRSRHSEDGDESASAPLTVHDLVQKVDSERVARRRRPEAPGEQRRPSGSQRREQPPARTRGGSAVAGDIAGSAPVPGRPSDPGRPASGRRAPGRDEPGRAAGQEAPGRPGAEAPRAGGRAAPGRQAPGANEPARRQTPQRATPARDEPPRPAGRQAPAREEPARAAGRQAPPRDEPARPAARQTPAREEPPRQAPAPPPGRAEKPDARPTPEPAADSTRVHRQAPAAPARPRPEKGRKPPAAPRGPVADEPAEDVTEEIPPIEPEPEQRPGDAWPKTSGAARGRKTRTQEKPRSVGPRKAGATGVKNKRARLALRSSVAAVAVLALLTTGGGWSYLRATDSGFTQVNALDENPEDVLDSDLQLGDENFLIVGTDTRAGVNGDIGAGTLDDAEGARADTVMLVNIPKNRSRVVVVSFPRDLDVTRPQCQGWDNDNGTYTQETFPSAMGDKLNAVYALGGPRCLVNVVRKMSGLSINRFIGIDFAGFEAMVDQVGGVEVCSTKPIIDDTLGTVLETSGKQIVSGQTALNYVRARHVYGEERSDYDRINRQQKFLASLLRGALSSKVLLDPGKMNGFVSAFTSHTFVDNVRSQDLLMLGRSLQKMSAGAVTFLTIPTAGTTSYGNEIPRDTDIKALFRAVIDDQPLPGEQKAPEITTEAEPPPAEPANKLTAVDPSIVSVQVSNASGMEGSAQRTATKLSTQGFGIYTTSNYSGGTSPTTRVRYATGHEAEAATVASSIPGASLERADELGSIVELVLGESYAGTVVPPTPVGTTLPSVPLGTPASAAPVALPSDLEHMNAADDTCK
ncbi:LCP family protein [Nocardia sp. NPDC050697]|uniref:LCP family protein n=1 Tax=Nocardia sp. NPDC050697 TaxID=3155158 RepID=UPI0033EA1598